MSKEGIKLTDLMDEKKYKKSEVKPTELMNQNSSIFMKIFFAGLDKLKEMYDTFAKEILGKELPANGRDDAVSMSKNGSSIRAGASEMDMIGPDGKPIVNRAELAEQENERKREQEMSGPSGPNMSGPSGPDR